MSELSQHESQVSTHYSVANLEDVVLAAFESAGTAPADLDIQELARVDGFHVRGRASTLELIERVGRLEPDGLVIDVGSGLGGTARVLAETWKAHVTGVDLTEDYTRTASALSALVGFEDRTSFVQGSATSLPFHDDTFDLAWTEHTQMNVEDKHAFYSELARVVRPGGLIAFHDLFTVDGGEPQYPTPWASRAELSHLATESSVRTLLESELGLEVLEWVDCTQPAIEWVETMRAARANGAAPPAVGLHLLMGETTGVKIGNMYDAFENGTMRAIQSVVRVPS